MKLKTIYFDLGNVLVFFSLPKMFDQVALCTGMTPKAVKELLYETELRELYEKGVVNTEHLYRIFLKQAPHPFSLHEFMDSLSDIFTPNTELWPVVESLKRQGFRLILLSNTSECHYNYIYSHYRILHQFDYKVLSYEVGSWKPDPLIFQKALTHAQCANDECFYIDDIPEFVTGAKKVGLHGEVFTDVPKLKHQLIQLGCNL
ncbi:MAG TPA: HAD family phosphatase [Chlamydiales bacterium]|nr:HAD family phosphatase [Chlamydiales bacterium]